MPGNHQRPGQRRGHEKAIHGEVLPIRCKVEVQHDRQEGTS